MSILSRKRSFLTSPWGEVERSEGEGVYLLMIHKLTIRPAASSCIISPHPQFARANAASPEGEENLKEIKL